MTENLKTTKYSDGTAIPLVTDSASFEDATTPAYCWYENDEATYGKFGALYNNYAVGTGKLCPEGWHVPDDNEWFFLENYVDPSITAAASGARGIDAGTKLKSTSWGGTDDFGFAGLAAGGFSTKGAGHGFLNTHGTQGYFWTSTIQASDNTRAMRRMLTSAVTIFKGTTDRSGGYSVRCIKDEGFVQDGESEGNGSLPSMGGEYL